MFLVEKGGTLESAVHQEVCTTKKDLLKRRGNGGKRSIENYWLSLTSKGVEVQYSSFPEEGNDMLIVRQDINSNINMKGWYSRFPVPLPDITNDDIGVVELFTDSVSFEVIHE